MNPGHPPADGSRRFLIVRSAELHCAVPAARVRRVARDIGHLPLPGGRPHLIGLGQYGGEPLAILDLRALVTGQPPAADPQATVIVTPRSVPAAARLGLGVDEAMGVFRLSTEPCPRDPPRLVVGTSFSRGVEVAVLDPEVLFDDRWHAEGSGNA